MTTEPTHYIIPAPLLAATLDYLSRRPFVEVADAINELRRLEAYTPSQEVEVATVPSA